MCNRTTVCGTPGYAAAYNFAAKNFRWVENHSMIFQSRTSLPAFTSCFLPFCVTTGGHSWWVYPMEDLPCTHEMNYDSLIGAAPVAPQIEESVTETGARASVAQLSVALGGLRTVFSPLLFRGLFSFFAWWIAACLFSTSLFGLFYHQYLMAA